MHKLIYLMPRLDTVEAMAQTLSDMKLGDRAYRVISRDGDNIRRHHLRDGSVLDQTDMLHMMERGALGGILCGVLLALGLMVIQPLGIEMTRGGFMVAVLIGMLFGSWVGAVAGLGNENYKLTPFHDALAHGQFLVVIRLHDPQQISEVRQIMTAHHPEAIFMADDDTLTNPFASKAEFPIRHAH